MKHVVLAVGLGIAGVLVFVQPAWAAASVAPPIPVGVAPNEVTFSPDGTVAYSANSGSNDISVIDVASGTTVGLPIPVDAQPVSIAYPNLVVDLLGNLRQIPNFNPDILITKLKESRWFL